MAVGFYCAHNRKNYKTLALHFVCRLPPGTESSLESANPVLRTGGVIPLGLLRTLLDLAN